MSRRRTRDRDRTWTPEPETTAPVTQTAASVPDQPLTPDGKPACIYGCTNRGEHTARCKLLNPDSACPGCAPRPAHEGSLLCGRCFFRKLKSPLRHQPAIYDWLGTRMGGIKPQSNNPGVSGSHDAPIPINTGIHDHRVTLRMLMGAWARRVEVEHPWVATKVDGHQELVYAPIPGPADWDVKTTTVYLERHAAWISGQPMVKSLVSHLRELTNRATGLGPVQQTRTMLGLPCPKCQGKTLALFGGDDWITCLTPKCGNIIGWYRYERLVKRTTHYHQINNLGGETMTVPAGSTGSPIADFILGCVTQDEAQARAANDEDEGFADVSSALAPLVYGGPDNTFTLTARVLAECKAQRERVEWALGIDYDISQRDPEAQMVGDYVLRIDAEVYANRAGYLPEWQPDPLSDADLAKLHDAQAEAAQA